MNSLQISSLSHNPENSSRSAKVAILSALRTVSCSDSLERSLVDADPERLSLYTVMCRLLSLLNSMFSTSASRQETDIPVPESILTSDSSAPFFWASDMTADAISSKVASVFFRFSKKLSISSTVIYLYSFMIL